MVGMGMELQIHSLIPRPPPFLLSICIHDNPQKRNNDKKTWKKACLIHHMSAWI